MKGKKSKKNARTMSSNQFVHTIPKLSITNKINLFNLQFCCKNADHSSETKNNRRTSLVSGNFSDD